MIAPEDMWPRELAIEQIQDKNIGQRSVYFNPHLFGTHMLFLYELPATKEIYYEIKFELPVSRSLDLNLITVVEGYVRTEDWYDEEGRFFEVWR